MLGIDVMDHVVVGGRLAPAHVSPVSAEHSSEVTIVTAKATARASKRRPGIGECPSGPAVGGAINHIGAVAEATAHFIHARNVNVACKQIASDLNVSDGAGPAKREVLRCTPSGTVIGRKRDRDGRPSNSEVVKGNVHPPVESRRGIHVAPARLAVVVAAVVDASANSPGDAAVSGRPVADSGIEAAAAASEKYGVPGGVRAVIKDNWVTEISSVPSGERAGVKPGEGEAAVTGVGCPGIVGGGGS